MKKYRLILVLACLLTACGEIQLPQGNIQLNPLKVAAELTSTPLTPDSTTQPVTAASPTPGPTIPLSGVPLPIEFSGKGKVNEAKFYSSLLARTMPYRIYLPPDYFTSQKRYPVLYMLHGVSGKSEEWMWYGLIGRFDDIIANNGARPFIIVLPTGDQEYWVDHPDDGLRWGEYTAREVVTHIDGNYRTLPVKESRAIGGLSMGAVGALQVAMSYPDVFGVVGAHSPTLRTFEQKMPWWGDESWFLAHSPIELAKISSYLPQVKLWIDIGSDDKLWLPRALELRQILLERKIDFKWTNYPGEHDAAYWSANVLDYLAWYGGALSFKE